MEKGINALIMEHFDVEGKDVRTYSPLALAYIGDAIFDLVVRTLTVDAGNTSVNKMHKKTSDIVNAKAQCRMLKAIEPKLSDGEKDVVRRGKNTKMYNTAKHASNKEYRNATGFEALLGYLYLTHQSDRMFEIIKISLENKENK